MQFVYDWFCKLCHWSPNYTAFVSVFWSLVAVLGLVVVVCIGKAIARRKR